MRWEGGAMATATDELIVVDSEGVARVAGTRFRVCDLARNVWRGWSASFIREQHPSLSQEQVDAALAYYYENPAEVDVQIGRLEREFQANRAAEDAKFDEEVAVNNRAYAEQRDAIRREHKGKYVGFAFGRVVAVADDADVVRAAVDALDPPPRSSSWFLVSDDPLMDPVFELWEDYRGGYGPT